MALIKLTGIPHPDLNGGRPNAVYIDASRVLLIIQGHCQHAKISSIEQKQEEYGKLRAGAMRLTAVVDGYMPKMDDPLAVGWMRTAQMAAHAVTEAAREWHNWIRENDYHPRVDCTEVQLACGTALEHGVMLTRVWVSETPEQVADLVAGPFAKPYP
jgi:hypothetical protein